MAGRPNHPNMNGFLEGLGLILENPAWPINLPS